MKQIQFGFFGNTHTSKSFGGELLSGKRKTKRPLSTKDPLHLVLRATHSRVFRPQNESLEKLIHRTAKEAGIRIYQLAVNWSHIHFVLRLRRREDYVKFVRVLNSRLAAAVLKRGVLTKASVCQKNGNGKLFALRPFSRILRWGRDFENVMRYLGLNLFEAEGWIKRQKMNLKQIGAFSLTRSKRKLSFGPPGEMHD